MKPRVLVVDDHIDMADTLADNLGERGFVATACASSTQAVKLLEGDSVDAVVTDLRMPEVDGLGLLAISRRLAPERPVIVMTAYGAIESAVDAIRRGAYHYLTKPFAVEELTLFLGRALEDARVRREARTLRAALRDEHGFGTLISATAAMREVFDLAARVADAPTPLLLVGETGTGKTALARAIHASSVRARAPFVAVNCAALPEALLESELFGHVKGAFTGATTARLGLFAEADGGTLLLDEVGEMSPALQSKLLQVLEGAAVRAVGSSRERNVNVRVVAATHRDLRKGVRAETFREDLLYRLDVVTIEIPPLRRRREDIPVLIAHLLAKAKAGHPRSVVERFAPEALARLMDHPWPGNVRELAHAIERAVLLGREAEAQLSDLPPAVLHSRPVGMGDALPSGEGAVLPIRDVQRRYALWAFEQCSSHKGRTAEALEVDPKTLAKWLNGDPDDNG